MPDGMTGSALDLETAELADLEREICGWAGRIAAATCRMLLALAAFDRRKGWSGLGMATCAHWLSWRCGLSVRTAQEHMAVARALEELSGVRAAFAAGRLSYSKVRAVARVAGPETEQTWLKHALHCTAGQLERLASRYHQLTADPSQQRAARRVSWSTRSDGLFRLSAVLTAEEGARLAAAIDAARASLDDSSPPPTAEEPGAAPADGEIAAAPRDRRADADALVTLAEGFLSRPAPGLSPSAHTLTVHIDAETLLGRTRPAGPRGDADSTREAARGGTASDRDDDGRDTGVPSAGTSATGVEPEDVAGARAAAVGTDPVSRLAHGSARCDAEPGIGLPRAVLRRLGCDALVRALLSDEAGNPLALGRRRRVPTRRLREAVYSRDQGACQYPGCARTRWLQVHHLREWLAGEGETDLENLALVCSRHHGLIHDEGITLRRGDGRGIEAVLADGSVLGAAPGIDAGERPAESLARAAGHVTADAIHTRGGGRLSWDDSLYVLLQHRHQPGPGPTAPTHEPACRPTVPEPRRGRSGEERVDGLIDYPPSAGGRPRAGCPGQVASTARIEEASVGVTHSP
ncbi:DUF222 domain-containing protein [Frankia sp. CNm7]|uniref:DUF222 domain-containing protein n=1 Tax=Frankia nepalensis TaxID=1836974 RepID=A0A937RPM8_9ACTN|nr:HNH endonuclease signature motif containing protein [Frankia nepalensis]MBL7502205.1 DUF222 domain-containing protein [Frankia nepalensis]MBL7513478.1 DUF222 domain-containing protein [Frankia nepalensis]MBL7522634.1 DUF222 domain-containing protein [Frankia nepalensis]MBL7630338.1 DUF222 domain-containing protein [Frankia nepalensis]